MPRGDDSLLHRLVLGVVQSQAVTKMGRFSSEKLLMKQPVRGNMRSETTLKFNGWFADVAKPGTDLQAVLFEMLSILTERAVMGESLSYELHRQHTISGRPEIITIGPEDVEATEVDDDDGDDA